MADEKKKHPGGRPTKFSKELADKICRIVSTHPYGLKKLTRMFPEFPSESTINEWRLDYKEFSVSYAQAKLIQADLLAEECLDISDDSSNDTNIDRHGNETLNGEWVARSRLRVDTRKWMASKLLPKQYGDSKYLEEKIEENQSLKEELRILRELLAEQNKKDY